MHRDAHHNTSQEVWDHDPHLDGLLDTFQDDQVHPQRDDAFEVTMLNCLEDPYHR